ncbi:ATP-binding protein [Bacillus haynesii]|uniref:ATP-binding protein n=1 Tax=Bacillus haynesii TaxID=1925021 RepID=UPI0022829CA9|nr:ATP-binding protein [Bacillus haynesii]MCY8713053.1 histidine kinase [Bacillus haynesii]MCY8738549.1 histidine kinase [Bacillus haynesii]MCY9147418.1 histidine kinase [Bacillus haynesii]MCY9317124.1 histidine kinase [Bacillus haynesii]MCY9331109.1 histidine kinase [Bacillus haynesii]
MKFSLKVISVILVCLSFIYSCYVVYICYNNLFVGAYLKYDSDNQLVVDYVEEDSLADYTGLKAGDIILEVNHEKPRKDVPKNSILSNVSSLSIERNGQIITTDTRDTIISYDILFTVLIPIVFYLLCLFCIILILKSKKTKKQTSSFLLILFLLTVSIAYVSVGGTSRGNVFSRYVNLLTFISIPINYLHFIYQYFKEIGKKLCSNKVFFFYLLPVFNLVLEILSNTFEKLEEPIPYINLYSFFIGLVLVIFVFVYGLVKYKNTEQTYFLKMLMLGNFFAIFPFIAFYLVPVLVIDDFIYSAAVVAPFLLIIPFTLVYQFISNKIYDVEFLIGRLKYYGLLAIIPTIIMISTVKLMKFQEGDYYDARLAIYVYLVILGVFYLKEILDYRFRLKRFSEKYNYQDSIFKFTQTIRTHSSLNQVLLELKQTILDVLIVSQAHVLKVKSDGTISLLEGDTEEYPWIPYEQEVTKVITDIGKIVEVDRGFLVKIGERGGTSYVMLCLSVLNTPRLTRDEISWLETLAFYTSVSLENVLKIGELMEHLEHVKKEGPNPAWLNKLMFAIEEKQRSDLARDLHDSVLQDMISLKHQSEMFLANFEKDKVCTNQIRQRLINMNEQMSTVIQTTRETCQELRPQLLYDLGLVKALSKLAAQHQESSSIDKIRLNTERFSKVLDLDTQLNLYRIVQELLSNAVKHSKAKEVLIMLVCIKEKVVLHYEDDGIGVDPDNLYQNSASMGLSGIRERVRALNGSLDIQTAEGKGFRVAIEMEL